MNEIVTMKLNKVFSAPQQYYVRNRAAELICPSFVLPLVDAGGSNFVYAPFDFP